MNYSKILSDIRDEITPFEGVGKQADYIPELAKVDPDQFGMSIQTISGKRYSIGDADVRFSI